MIDDRQLKALAADQHGLVSISQMAALGIDKHRRQCLIDGIRWARRSRRVVGVVGAPITAAQTAMLAVLDGGPSAALRGTSAAAWWGMPGMSLSPLQVSRTRHSGHHDPVTGRVHDPLLLPPEHVLRLDGVPTVVPARAIFDIAGSKRRGAEIDWWVDRVARLVDNAWALRLVSGTTLHAMLDDLAQRGRPGIQVMRLVLEDRGTDYVPPASGLESRVVQILTNAGEAPMRRQVNTGDAHRWIGRVDFRDDHRPHILEVQSERFHTSLIDRQLDAERIARLRAAGFVVTEVTDVQVWTRPNEVVAAVRAGRMAADANARAGTPVA